MWYQKYEFMRENILSIVHKDHLNDVSTVQKTDIDTSELVDLYNARLR